MLVQGPKGGLGELVTKEENSLDSQCWLVLMVGCRKGPAAGHSWLLCDLGIENSEFECCIAGCHDGTAVKTKEQNVLNSWG